MVYGMDQLKLPIISKFPQFFPVGQWGKRVEILKLVVVKDTHPIKQEKVIFNILQRRRKLRLVRNDKISNQSLSKFKQKIVKLTEDQSLQEESCKVWIHRFCIQLKELYKTIGTYERQYSFSLVDFERKQGIKDLN